MDEERGSRRVRRSRSEITELIAAFEASGQTQQRFCADRGLCAGTFAGWTRKRRAAATPEGFRSVRLLPAAAADASVTVRLPDGIEVDFPLGTSTAEVAAFIMSVRGSAAGC